MEMQTVITLLTIIVTVLSFVMIALLAVIVTILFKVQSLLGRLNVILANVAKASEWVAPTKIIDQIVNIFRK